MNPKAGSLVALFAAVAIAGAAPRERVRFDDGWRFLRLPETEAGGVSSPFPWEWRFANHAAIPGAPTLADLASPGDWQPARIGENVFRGGYRWAWFRATIPADPNGARKRLYFDAVDDTAEVYLNGKRLIRHEGWNEPFDVPVAEAWNPNGPNQVVVLVDNTGGGGGIIGSVRFEEPRAESFPKASPSYPDRTWRPVHLPHDYVVEGTFRRDADGSHGFLPKPMAWYRKTFSLPKDWQGRKVWLEFDGVYRDARVFLNGQPVHRHPSGYIGFRIDLSRANFGRPNTLAIRVDPRQNEGWWYEGGGIYRHVWLNATDPIHVLPNGVFVRSEVEGETATVSIDAEATNAGAKSASVAMESTLVDPSGRTVATMATDATLAPTAVGKVRHRIRIPKPVLWDLETPRLYTLRTTLRRGRRVLDEVRTPFGIRTIRWDKDRGFFLNGRHVLLKGTCNHQDHAGVGVAIPDRLQWWRIRKLKEMGSNAYRCSHNPPAPEVLEACDRFGMLVLDETRHFGDTTMSKSPGNTGYDDLWEFKELLRRDRNHPSVIAWSVANEEPIIGTPLGARVYEAMKRVAAELDPTRITTGALNFGWDSGAGPLVDLMGFNYNIDQWDRVRAKYPEKPMFGSETASTVSTRGVYANDPVRGYVSAYDVNHPQWGATAERAWKAVVERPWIAGGFVWTGFDYKGEPTPYEWPCINSHFGILDIAGFPKDNFFYYQAWWSDRPVLHVLPHWNWPDRLGQTINVWVHSNADRVELLLNGRSLGAKEMPRYGHLEWDVPYAPGTLEARGTRAGQPTLTRLVQTTGAPAALRLSSDWKDVLADQEDAALVAVEVVDADGNVVSTADNRVSFRVEGEGRVVGVGNGDPSDHDPDTATYRRAFNGKCMVLVGRAARKGRLTVIATAPGLRAAQLTLPVIRQ